MSSEPDLAGQVGVVTGAGRGIGRAIALKLAGCGMKLVAVARSTEEIEETARLVTSAGGQALAIAADVTDRHAIEALAWQVVEKWGQIDFLVSNAGSNSGFGPVAAADPEKWWRDVEVNLRGPFLCARAVLPGMIQRGRGRIVNVIGGIDRAILNQSAYSSSKVGLVRFTETLAAEVAARGIKAFAMGPGAVDTRLTRQVFESTEGAKWNAEMRSTLNWRGPEAAAELAALFASGKADALSGRCVRVEDNAARLVEERLDELVASDAYVMRRRVLP